LYYNEFPNEDVNYGNIVGFKPPFDFFAPSPLLRVRSWLHPFKSHCEQKAMRDEGVIYVAGHP